MVNFRNRDGVLLNVRNKAGDLLNLHTLGEDPDAPLSMVDPSTPSGVQPAGTSGLGLSLTLSEEFNSAMHVTDAELGKVTFRPSGYEWNTWYPNWSRFTDQVPGGNHTNTNQEAYYDTSKVTVSSGALRLLCHEQETEPGLPYTAGMITSKDMLEQQYGWFEARIRMVGGRNNRHWPAAWMATSVFNQWPPEVDFYEVFGLANEYLTNVYRVGSSDIHPNSFSDFTNWHVFGVHWSADEVTFYRDGVETYTSTPSVTGPQYLIFNNGAETGATGSMPAVEIDYIRSWSES